MPLKSTLDGTTRTLAGTGIGTGTLSTQRQSTAMTYATVTAQIHQPLDVHGDFTTQITFNGEFTYLGTDPIEVFLGQFLYLALPSNSNSVTNKASTSSADAVDRRQGNHCVLFIRNIDSSNTGHEKLLKYLLPSESAEF
jgi:hypothetical protein